MRPRRSALYHELSRLISASSSSAVISVTGAAGALPSSLASSASRSRAALALAVAGAFGSLAIVRKAFSISRRSRGAEFLKDLSSCSAFPFRSVLCPRGIAQLRFLRATTQECRGAAVQTTDVDSAHGGLTTRPSIFRERRTVARDDPGARGLPGSVALLRATMVTRSHFGSHS